MKASKFKKNKTLILIDKIFRYFGFYFCMWIDTQNDKLLRLKIRRISTKYFDGKPTK